MTSPTVRLAFLLVCALAAACGGMQAGSGLGPPVLVGEYELIGPLERDGSDGPVVYRVTMLSDDKYRYRKDMATGPDPLEARYETTRSYVRFGVDGYEIRVRRGEGDALIAEVRGEYVLSERTEEVCSGGYTVSGNCASWSTVVRQDRRQYQREVVFRRSRPSG